jgi:hypothetical protein
LLRSRAFLIGGLTMRTTKQSAGQVDRRSLLKGAGLALGAAAATTAGAVEKASAGGAQSAAEYRGYRETEEVRTYYKLARF